MTTSSSGLSTQVEGRAIPAVPSAAPAIRAGSDGTEPYNATASWESLPPVDLAAAQLDSACIRMLPLSLARRLRVLALCRVGEEIVVATSNRRLDRVQRFVQKHVHHPFCLMRGDEDVLKRLLMELGKSPIGGGASLGVGMAVDSGDAVATCDELLEAGLLRSASDIHLVPNENEVEAKLRVDGVLETYRTLPRDSYGAIVSRFKVLASLDISNTRLPQDGRFTVSRARREAESASQDGQSRHRWHRRRPPATTTQKIDVRAATIPTRFGERVTLRLLAPLPDSTSVADLGMQAGELDAFRQAIRSPHGLLLLTGPTGCGKSTTLYAAIQQLLREQGGNIMTVEDPIEYEIRGATQVEVDSADRVSFTRALRSILRHDPNVIMLGEIRDAETAEIAIKASLTGHLVFSTLHTNTAAGVVTRLLDMRVEPYLVAATLRLALAQRLVRKLCPHCKRATGIDARQAASLGKPELEGQTAWEPRGCVYCAGRGFRGRVALFEMLTNDTQVAEMITRRESEQALLEIAHARQASSLLQDGVRRIADGTTSIDEVSRVVKAW